MIKYMSLPVLFESLIFIKDCSSLIEWSDSDIVGYGDIW
jgi:hypothetical protein